MSSKENFQYPSAKGSKGGYSSFRRLKTFRKNESLFDASGTNFIRYRGNSNHITSQQSDNYTNTFRVKATLAEHDLVESSDQNDIVRAVLKDAAHGKTSPDMGSDSATIVAEDQVTFGIANNLLDSTSDLGTLDSNYPRVNEASSSYDVEKTNRAMVGSPKISQHGPGAGVSYVPKIYKGASNNGPIGGKRHKVRFWRNNRRRNKHKKFCVNENHFSEESTSRSNQLPIRKHHFRRWLNEKTDESATVNHIEEARHRAKYVASEAALAAIIRCHARAAIRAGAAATAAYAKVTFEELNPGVSHATMIATINKACEDVAKTSLKSKTENADYLKLLHLLNQHLNFKGNELQIPLKSCDDKGELEKKDEAFETSIRQADEHLYNSQTVTSLKIPPKNSSENKKLLQKSDDHTRQTASSLISENSISEKLILQVDAGAELPLTQLVVPNDSARDDNYSKEYLDELSDPLKSMTVEDEDEDFEGSRFVLFSSAESALDFDDDDSRRKDETELSLIDSAYSYVDSEEGIWPQVASMRRQRLLLQMESLAPRSLLLESLTKDC
ncbi:hypothetical protein ZYGR_0AD02040 [Zygosaccharomyces rouxii]|uniref:Uncharacterized protein n=1 Tax=Zygosaccharomyces rouxii TaxID=4956 RepID=A0A1Q3A5U8_ZYGRO|nr:hypothetical protein ZYGR_0AD02040 [Zygosaccharomyces rouxii]